MRTPALHPRASFDIYSASVRGQCAPWKQRDVDAAAGLGLLVDDMTRSCGDPSMGDDADDSSALGLRMVRADDKRTRGEAEKTVAETKRLLESVRAPVFAVDEGFAVAQWNMMIQRLTGYTKPDMLGRSISWQPRAWEPGRGGPKLRDLSQTAVPGGSRARCR